MENFKPLRGLVLVKRDKPESESGGIIIPENCQVYGWCAEVLEVGEGVKNVSPGDRIMFQKEYCVLPFKDRTLGITDADKLLARLIPEGDTERISPLNKYVLVAPSVEPKTNIEIIGAYQAISQGIVQLTGRDCIDVGYGFCVWYPKSKRVLCVENNQELNLVDESEILMCEIGE